MTALYAVVALVALQRFGELAHARRNTRRLLARGGVEHDRAGYPVIVALHVAWLASMLVFIPAETRPAWWLLGLYLALQGVRYWAVFSLGAYWTTRIITVPGAPLIRRGPYRHMRHPNYVVVAIEIALLPLAFGALDLAALFSLANAALLWRRARLEERVLAPRENGERPAYTQV